MIKGLDLARAASCGVFLGCVFFGGLWWTVRRGLLSAAPAVWFSGSLLIRSALALGGFYLISRGDRLRLAACLLGFLLARFMIIRRTQTRPGASARRTAEATP